MKNDITYLTNDVFRFNKCIQDENITTIYQYTTHREEEMKA